MSDNTATDAARPHVTPGRFRLSELPEPEIATARGLKIANLTLAPRTHILAGAPRRDSHPQSMELGRRHPELARRSAEYSGVDLTGSYESEEQRCMWLVNQAGRHLTIWMSQILEPGDAPPERPRGTLLAHYDGKAFHAFAGVDAGSGKADISLKPNNAGDLEVCWLNGKIYVFTRTSTTPVFSDAVLLQLQGIDRKEKTEVSTLIQIAHRTPLAQYKEEQIADQLLKIAWRLHEYFELTGQNAGSDGLRLSKISEIVDGVAGIFSKVVHRSDHALAAFYVKQWLASSWCGKDFTCWTGLHRIIEDLRSTGYGHEMLASGRARPLKQFLGIDISLVARTIQYVYIVKLELTQVSIPIGIKLGKIVNVTPLGVAGGLGTVTITQYLADQKTREAISRGSELENGSIKKLNQGWTDHWKIAVSQATFLSAGIGGSAPVGWAATEAIVSSADDWGADEVPGPVHLFVGPSIQGGNIGFGGSYTKKNAEILRIFGKEHFAALDVDCSGPSDYRQPTRKVGVSATLLSIGPGRIFSNSSPPPDHKIFQVVGVSDGAKVAARGAGEVHFRLGDALLTDSGWYELSVALSQERRTFQDSSSTLIVAAHTDRVDTEEHNNDLSACRAWNVYHAIQDILGPAFGVLKENTYLEYTGEKEAEAKHHHNDVENPEDRRVDVVINGHLCVSLFGEGEKAGRANGL